MRRACKLALQGIIFLPLGLAACSEQEEPRSAPAANAPAANTAGEDFQVAPPSGFSSERTDFSFSSCAGLPLGKDEATGEIIVNYYCPGHDGIPVYISQHRERFDVDVGWSNSRFEAPAIPAAPAGSFEWRLKDGKPFAVIYDYEYRPGDFPSTASIIAVTKIGAGPEQGCLTALVDANMADPQGTARRFADNFVSDFQCGFDVAKLFTDNFQQTKG